MKTFLLIFSILPHLLLAQMEYRSNPDDSTDVIEMVIIPPDLKADSVVQYIYNLNPNNSSITYSQRFGPVNLSNKISVNEFYEWTKKHCIERVGERYFYDNFRLNRHSFKDDLFSEIYEIRYYFFPPGFSYDYQIISFKRFVFMGLDETQVPENLPDCMTESMSCSFPITREKALEIAVAQVVKKRPLKVYFSGLTSEYKWDCRTYSESHWYGEYFTIDARTGEVSELRQYQRID